MGLIKSDLRSLMKEKLLDSLVILGFHRKRSSNIDFDQVVDRFKARFPMTVSTNSNVLALNFLKGLPSFKDLKILKDRISSIFAIFCIM